tara:strand:- start:2101 stop:2385 length:285 start_codon:yes stop_codon:yes gene_type:complete
MDIYRYFAEDSSQRFIFLFTYKAAEEDVLLRLQNILGYEPYIYDIFPEPNQEEYCVEDILSVITKNGSEMFIPSGLHVKYFDQIRVLFGRGEVG